MSRAIVLASVVVVLLGGRIAVGQTPSVESLYDPFPPLFEAEAGLFVDITPSVRQVTIPA